MTFGFCTQRTIARFRTAAVVATLAASVPLLSVKAQSPSRPPDAQDGQGQGRGTAPQQPPTPPRPTPSFKAGVDLVSLNVTVTDPAARYITDLEQGDFQV